MGSGPLDLDTMLTAIESRITSQVAGTSVSDYLDAPAASGRQRAAMGVRVWCPGTAYEYSGSPGWQMADDTVQIDALWEVKPRNQIASRTASIQWRDDIILAVTDLAWSRGIGFVSRLASTATEYQGEWIAHTIILTTRRRQAIG